MFQDIKDEINTFPLNDLQKKYIESAMSLAYDKGIKDGVNKSGIILEEEDLKKV